MLKWIGSLLILCGAGGFGIGKALRFRKQMRQLKELIGAMEILKCELNYTLMPVAELCRMTASRVGKAPAIFLQTYARSLDQGRTRQKSAQLALEEAGGTELPNAVQMAMLELFGNLGRYDLDGENRLIKLTQARLEDEYRQYEQEKRPLVKGYAVLGLCVGAAIVILFI